MGPLQRTLSVEDGARVVRAAVEGGITFIDTATLYGTYEHIARGLKGLAGFRHPGHQDPCPRLTGPWRHNMWKPP